MLGQSGSQRRAGNEQMFHFLWFEDIESEGIVSNCRGEMPFFLTMDEKIARSDSEKREIESAFKNIITNAIRYTEKDGHINIRWKFINGLGIFEVSDSGIGIPKSDINRISERFYRVNPDRSRETGGTGLGLAIVKNVMIQHQGELKITSELGSGSTFKLIFPAERLIHKPNNG